MLTEKTSQSRMSVRIEGRKPPFSQFATHCFETPSFSAKSTCLQPRVFLSCRILSPSSVRVSSSISFLHFRGVRADAVASGLFSVRTTSASHASACMVPPSPCVAGRRTAFHPQHAPSRSSGKHGVGGNRPHPAFLPDVASAICFCICVCRHTHISSIAKRISGTSGWQDPFQSFQNGLILKQVVGFSLCGGCRAQPPMVGKVLSSACAACFQPKIWE